jgi:hypothetical protein
MLRPVLVTPPSGAIVTLAEAKLHLRVDYTDDDALIQSLVDAAVAHLDGYSGRLGRPLLSQTWAQSFPNFSPGQRTWINQSWMPGYPGSLSCPWRLRFADFISITDITYFDTTNSSQTLSSSIYTVLTDEIGPYINLVYGKSYPNVFPRDDAVTVTWVCGFGATAANIPTDIKLAIKMMVAHWYENRGVIVTEKRLEIIPMAVDALLTKYTRVAV